MNKSQKKLLHYAYDLLARRRYTIKGLHTRLAAKNTRLRAACSEQEIEHIITSLKQANFLNDKDYAEAYISTELARKPQGSLRLRHKLLQKGVNNQLIQEVLAEQAIDELEAARVASLNKLRTMRIGKLDNHKLEEKLFRFLIGRGFKLNTVYQVVKQKLYKN